MNDSGNNDRGAVPPPGRRRDYGALRRRRGAGGAPGKTASRATPRRAGTPAWRALGAAGSLVTIVVGAATLYQCWFEGPDPKEKAAYYRAKIAELEALKDPSSTGPAIHRYLSAMHRDGHNMRSIVITGVVLEMAEFEGTDWSWATMTEVEFTCSGQVHRDLGPFGSSEDKPRPCARLRNSHFVSTGLHRARFDFADLRGSNFNNSQLNGAKIFYSVLSKASLSGATLSGIHLEGSDFERAMLGSSRQFICYENNQTRVCPLIRNVVFRNTQMPLARFVGADIQMVDFASALLSETLFDCQDPDKPRTCTSLYGACFRGADLTKADFANVEISHSDFSDARMAGAIFRNVRFDDVVFPPEVSDAAKFDRASAASLEAARLTRLGRDERDRPCAPAWRRALAEERHRVAFAPRP